MADIKKLKIAYEDIERLTIKGETEVMEKVSASLQKKIVMQVNDEYELCYPHAEAKRAVMLKRLTLYNNQRKNSDAIGDNTLFTVFNTLLAALYDDRLSANWEGRGGEGDEDVEENLNALAEYDYDVMGKDELDYEWDWDAMFFGRGLMLVMEFDRDKRLMSPVPEVLDPTVFIRDPNAASVNGNRRRRGAMRFGGWEAGASYWELKELPGYFNLDSLKKDKEMKSLMRKTQEARDMAIGRDKNYEKEESLGKYGNYEYNLLNWFTTIKGEKYLVTLANSRTQVIRLLKLDYDNLWPIIDRPMYPMAHDWDGVSVPDLVEDKQRMKAVMLNLGLKSAKADVMARYLFDKTRIKNKNELNYRSNKYIGVDGRVDNAIAPVAKSNAHLYVNQIIDILDVSAQRATAATELRQGIQSKVGRTLGEQQLASAGGELRFNLSAKIWGWSERAFWQQWYRLYKKHFKSEIDEKVIRIQGPLAPKWRPLNRENIVAEVDPDVKIESRVVTENKRQIKRQSFMSFAGLAINDPETDRRFTFKHLARMHDMKKEEIDLMFPPTVDELQAQDENDLLNESKVVPINLRDNHKVHIQIHAKADQNPQSVAHIRAHKAAMLVVRNNPELFPTPAQPTFSVPGGGGAPVSAGRPAASTPTSEAPAENPPTPE